MADSVENAHRAEGLAAPWLPSPSEGIKTGRPSPMQPNPNESLAAADGTLMHTLARALLVLVGVPVAIAVAAPLLAWALYIGGPALQWLAHAYGALWPPPF